MLRGLLWLLWVVVTLNTFKAGFTSGSWSVGSMVILAVLFLPIVRLE